MKATKESTARCWVIIFLGYFHFYLLNITNVSLNRIIPPTGNADYEIFPATTTTTITAKLQESISSIDQLPHINTSNEPVPDSISVQTTRILSPPPSPLPRFVILPGPHKSGTTSTQNCIYNWLNKNPTQQNNSKQNKVIDGWVWPVPPPSELKELNVRDFGGPKGFAQLGLAARSQERIDDFLFDATQPYTNHSASQIYNLYQKHIFQSWYEHKQNIIIGSEEMDGVVAYGKPWNRHLMDVILSMLPIDTSVSDSPMLSIDDDGSKRNTVEQQRSEFFKTSTGHTRRNPVFDLQNDVVAAVNYRTPRIEHLKSLWRQVEANIPSMHGKSFKDFLIEQESFHEINSLGVAVEFLRRGVKTILINHTGMKEQQRDLCHVIACDVMMIKDCTPSGYLSTVLGNENKRSEIMNAREDPKSGMELTDDQVQRIEHAMLMYECGIKRELEGFRTRQQFQVLFDHHKAFLDNCIGVNSTARSYQWMSDEIKKIASEIPRSRVGMKRKRGTKTCIAFGIVSRGFEVDLRRFHREVFNSFHSELKAGDYNFHFVFAVSKVYDYNNTTADQMIDEQEKYGDILRIDIEEKYELLTAKTLKMLQALHPLVNNRQCKRGYIVKIDSDVVVWYDQLVQAINEMPSRSVYFGQMIPNAPFTKEDRKNSPGMPSSLNVLPLFANGPLYGVSRDLARTLLSSDIQSTVWNQKTSFIFREEDRAVGWALHHSQVPVRNYLHIPHIFTFCSREFSCDHYRNAMAICIGAGLSGSHKMFLAEKKKALALFYQKLGKCKRMQDPNPPEKTPFFNVKGNEFFERRRMVDVLVEGCLSIEPSVQDLIDYFNITSGGSLNT